MIASRQFTRGFRSIYRRGVLHRAIALVLLLVFVAVVGGVPLPTLKSTPKSSERFPCEASSCGCNSAERCWQGCCCHTLDQRLEWARKNGVRPPEFALTKAREFGKDTSAWDGSQKSIRLTFAAKTVAPSCCSKKSVPATHSCCCKKAAATRTCCSSPSKASSTRNEDQGVVAWRALACHGQSLNWLAAVPTLVHVDLELADQLPLVAWLGPHASVTASGIAEVPTPPPPECA